jgi:hypothetical protein
MPLVRRKAAAGADSMNSCKIWKKCIIFTSNFISMAQNRKLSPLVTRSDFEQCFSMIHIILKIFIFFLPALVSPFFRNFEFFAILYISVIKKIMGRKKLIFFKFINNIKPLKI